MFMHPVYLSLRMVRSVTLDATLRGDRRLRRDGLAAVDVGRSTLLGNVVTLLAPLFPEGVPEVLAALDGFYAFSAGATCSTVFLFSLWPTPDVRPTAGPSWSINRCCSALTWRVTLADPGLPALLLASDEGRPVYERMGYMRLFRSALWSRDRRGASERRI
jgi:hypothetical protein